MEFSDYKTNIMLFYVSLYHLKPMIWTVGNSCDLCWSNFLVQSRNWLDIGISLLSIIFPFFFAAVKTRRGLIVGLVAKYSSMSAFGFSLAQNLKSNIKIILHLFKNKYSLFKYVRRIYIVLDVKKCSLVTSRHKENIFLTEKL